MNRLNQSSGLERTERLLDLVPYLATHQGIPLEELAREFSITPSQLTEDLTTLWMCGLPGYTALELMDLSFDTGFVSITNAETLANPRVLNRDEVLALILGLESLQVDAKLNRADLDTTISKLVMKLIGFLDASVEKRVQSGTSALSRERAIIESAIANRGSISISYHSFSRDEISQRVIHPLEISMRKEAEYVLAFCEFSNSYRTFRLDRIVRAAEFEQPTTSPSSNLGEKGEKFLITLSVGSRMRDVVERFNLDVAKTASNPSKVLHVECFTVDWAIREIMSLGGDVRVDAPLHVRTSLRERASQALRAYAR